MRKVTTENKIRKSLSLAISVLMIASLASVMLLTVPLAGAAAMSIDPSNATPATGDVVICTIHSNTTSGIVTVRLVVDKNKDGSYQSATDVLAENTGSGAPGGVDIFIDVDTRGYADGTYKVYAAEGAELGAGEDLTSWSDVTTTFTTADVTAPVFKSAKTGDSADGNSSARNKIYLEFTEDGSGLDPATVATGDFTVESPSIVYGVDTGDNYIILTLAADLLTDATPNVAYDAAAFADITGNPVLVLTSSETSDGISPTMDSATTVDTTTIDVTFSEALDAGTVEADNFSVSGNTVDSASVLDKVVTLTLKTAIATDATPDVTYTKGVLADSAWNLVATTTLTPLDKAGPILEYVAWTDVDGSEVINGGDTLEFAFSEPMDTTTITPDTVNTVLKPGTGEEDEYGSAVMVEWNAAGDTVTVTLAYGEKIDSDDTVDPTDDVTDVATNKDATPSPVKIHNVSDPVILDGIHYPTIQEAINAASIGDTIEVMPGIYSTATNGEVFPITVNKENLTITSTGTAAETVIDAGGEPLEGDQGIIKVDTDASNVTIDGFTIENCTSSTEWGAAIYTGNGTTLNDLIIKNVHIGIYAPTYAHNLTVENSEIRDITQWFGIYLEQENAVIRNNDIENIVHPDLSGFGCGCGIQMKPGSSGTRVIENNTFRNVDTAIAYGPEAGMDNIGLTIENNNFLSCNEAAIQNETTYDNINAEYNYWGDDSGPAQAGDPVGTAAEGAGNAICEKTGDGGGNIDYSPWLTKPNGTHYDFTYVLEEGLNLVSLSLIPDDSSIEAILGSTADVNSVWSYDEQTKTWDGYDPRVDGDLTAMVDGEGYWIRIEEDAGKTVLAFNGHEYVSGVEKPSAYDVYVGWNLIGFKRTTSVIRSEYLGAVDDSTERCYEAPRGTYGIVENNDNMTPGYGYWLAVTEDGTIYP